MTSKNVEAARAVLQAMASGDPDVAAAPPGSGGLVRHDPGPPAGGGPVEIVRVLDEPPFVVVHGRDGAGAERVFFAVFRFQDDELAEQWRFSVPAAPPNRSGHSQTDGPTAPDRGKDTARSRALVRDYYETVHIAGHHDRIGHFMSDDHQIRHEPDVEDGVAAFTRDLGVLTRARTIDEIVLLIAEGDLVFIAARGTHEGRPCAYLDLYRVEADKLVEHWGFPQEMPPAASSDANGML